MWNSRDFLSRVLLRMRVIKTSNTRKFNKELDRKDAIFLETNLIFSNIMALLGHIVNKSKRTRCPASFQQELDLVKHFAKD